MNQCLGLDPLCAYTSHGMEKSFEIVCKIKSYEIKLRQLCHLYYFLQNIPLNIRDIG